MAKEKLSADEKLEKTDFDLFEALAALDRKDYTYYDRLTPDQQKKFVPFMMIQWMSAIKSNKDIQAYYLQSTDYHANLHLLNENITKHPKLQWLMLCAASPGIGKQFHQWIPTIRERVSKLKEDAKPKEIKDYFKKIYSGASSNELDQLTTAYISDHNKKLYIANAFPDMKFDEIELLSEMITDDDIKKYEESLGN